MQNLDRAQTRDAVLEQKFWVRSSILSDAKACDNLIELTADQVINGTTDFVGVAPLIDQYLDDQCDLTKEERSRIDRYVNFVKDRASGKTRTISKWMREFVAAHPEYQKDSKISKSIAYDLLLTVHRCAMGELKVEALTGGYE